MVGMKKEMGVWGLAPGKMFETTPFNSLQSNFLQISKSLYYKSRIHESYMFSDSIQTLAMEQMNQNVS